MHERICNTCKIEYQPKHMGFNAKFCSDKCKRRMQRSRLKVEKPKQLIDARKRSYEATKKNPERYKKHKNNSSVYRQKTRKWLAEYKVNSGCFDCGYKGHFSALQLDHEGKKSVEIADARSSVARLLKEIIEGKCVVRCANCHSIKTWERKNGIKS